MQETQASAQKGTVRQILLITDGCSNVGGDPVEVAREAKRKQIVVNVIGVVEGGELGRPGKEEVLSIADAGGGLCRVVQLHELSETAQMVTHQTMQMTLAQVVNQELMNVVGKEAEDLEPSERARIAQVVDKLEEELRFELIVAVDTSASMGDKMQMVREAIRDLAVSLEARQGETKVAVIAFPGNKGEEARVVQGFTDGIHLAGLEKMFAARGGTPTASALKEALELFAETGRLDTGQRNDSPMTSRSHDARSSNDDHLGVPPNHNNLADDDLPDHRWDGTSNTP